MPLIKFLSQTPSGVPLTIADIAHEFKLSEKTASERVKKAYEEHPELIGRVVGILPPALAVVQASVNQLGQVTSTNVMAINARCREIIDSTVVSANRNYVTALLSRHNMISSDGRLAGVVDDLVLALLDDDTGIADHLKAVGNGLVSLAGGVNEHILRLGLINIGLSQGMDFEKTGTKSEGDFTIYGDQRRRKLYVEVKSFKARERLLRGLQDIPYQDKVGVGFFTDPAEFNIKRTQTLLNAGPLAIYMPDETLECVAAGARERVTLQGDRLYRPLSSFFDDMRQFNKTGRLPQFI